MREQKISIFIEFCLKLFEDLSIQFSLRHFLIWLPISSNGTQETAKRFHTDAELKIGSMTSSLDFLNKVTAEFLERLVVEKDFNEQNEGIGGKNNELQGLQKQLRRKKSS